MRKAMIEEMLEKAMCYDGKVIKDTLHPISEFLPKGEQPLTSEENEYIDKRLFEESEWNELQQIHSPGCLQSR